jgi:hypothetical protein
MWRTTNKTKITADPTVRYEPRYTQAAELYEWLIEQRIEEIHGRLTPARAAQLDDACRSVGDWREGVASEPAVIAAHHQADEARQYEWLVEMRLDELLGRMTPYRMGQMDAIDLVDGRDWRESVAEDPAVVLAYSELVVDRRVAEIHGRLSLELATQMDVVDGWREVVADHPWVLHALALAPAA